MAMTTAGTDLLEGTIADAATALRRRSVSVQDLVDGALRAIERTADLNAYITVYAECAKAVAGAHQGLLNNGYDLGRLHGIPVAVKDNVGIAGVASTAGSRVLARAVAETDATVVTALERAGAIVVGRTNMYELAWGGTTANPHFGTGNNPWDETRSPGGSSGGSAATVAARNVFASLGTDTGGSVRVPAALNGITGIRPTVGRVSNAGVFPLAWTLDTVGPFAKSSEDCAIVLAAIAGHDPLDPQTSTEVVPDYVDALRCSLTGARIGVLEHYSKDNLQPAVRAAFESAVTVLEELGAVPTIVEIPDLDVLQEALRVLNAVEASALHAPWIGERGAEYGAEVRAQLEAGLRLSAIDYLQAQRYRTHVRSRFLEAFRSVDAIITPTLHFTAPEHGQTTVDIDGVRNDVLHSPRFTALASLTGLPAMSVPMGLDGAGLPMGFQIIGPAFSEARVLTIGHQFQGVTEHHLARPA